MGIRCWDPLQTGMRCLLAAHLPAQVTEMLPGCVPLQQDPVVGEKLILSLFSLQQGEKTPSPVCREKVQGVRVLLDAHGPALGEVELCWWLLLGALLLCKLLHLPSWQMAAPLPKIALVCCQLLPVSFGPLGGSPAPTCPGVVAVGGAARGLAPEPGLSMLSKDTAPAGCVGRAEPSCWGLLPAPDLQALGKKARSLVDGPEGALGDQTGRRKLLA